MRFLLVLLAVMMIAVPSRALADVTKAPKLVHFVEAVRLSLAKEPKLRSAAAVSRRNVGSSSTRSIVPVPFNAATDVGSFETDAPVETAGR